MLSIEERINKLNVKYADGSSPLCNAETRYSSLYEAVGDSGF